MEGHQGGADAFPFGKGLPWSRMEKEKEILPVKNGRRFPAGSLKSLDIKLTLIWYSVKRQGRRTQIGKGLIKSPGKSTPKASCF